MNKPYDGFFAVSISNFHSICSELGMNECCYYLNLCCGSDKTNTLSNWGASSLSRYTGIAKRRGLESASLLAKHGYITKTRGGMNVQHQIKRKRIDDEPTVWLPKSLVMGLTDQKSPLELIRQQGDHMILRLLIDLYWFHDIADDGGIRDIHVIYDKTHIAEKAQFNILGFNQSGAISVTSDHPVTAPHLDYTQEPPFEQFWDRFKALIALGLVYEVPTLFDAPSGEVIVPVCNPFDEQPVKDICLIAEKVLPDVYDPIFAKYEFKLLVLKHMKSATLKGMYVLRYRQHTKKTAAGYAKTMERIASYLVPIKELSRNYQGVINE